MKALLFEKGSKIIKFIPFPGLKPNSWGLSLELLFSLMRKKSNFPPFPHFLLHFSVDWPTHGCNLSSLLCFPDSFIFSFVAPFPGPHGKTGILRFLSGPPVPTPSNFLIITPFHTDTHFVKRMSGHYIFRMSSGKNHRKKTLV